MSRTSCPGVRVVLEFWKDELLGALRKASDLVKNELLRLFAGGCGLIGDALIQGTAPVA